jgi:hypothetical protein
MATISAILISVQAGLGIIMLLRKKSHKSSQTLEFIADSESSWQ